MERNKAGTLARLKSLGREIFDPRIAAHSVRMVKLKGDGALVEFASASFRSPARSRSKNFREHNAGAIEDEWIQFRIGINVGGIMDDGEDIYGEGVNVAVRIEVAEPGGIFISRVAADQVRDMMQC